MSKHCQVKRSHELEQSKVLAHNLIGKCLKLFRLKIGPQMQNIQELYQHLDVHG